MTNSLSTSLHSYLSVIHWPKREKTHKTDGKFDWRHYVFPINKNISIDTMVIVLLQIIFGHHRVVFFFLQLKDTLSQSDIPFKCDDYRPFALKAFKGAASWKITPCCPRATLPLPVMQFPMEPFKNLSTKAVWHLKSVIHPAATLTGSNTRRVFLYGKMENMRKKWMKAAWYEAEAGIWPQKLSHGAFLL